MFFATTIPGLARHTAVYPASRNPRGAQRKEAARDRQPEHGATVEQDETSTTMRFDVPGVTREQLDIGIDGNVVRIATVDGAPRQYRMAYRLGQDIALQGSGAKLENGVLTVRLVKQAPQSRVTELAIH